MVYDTGDMVNTEHLRKIETYPLDAQKLEEQVRVYRIRSANRHSLTFSYITKLNFTFSKDVLVWDEGEAMSADGTNFMICVNNLIVQILAVSKNRLTDLCELMKLMAKERRRIPDEALEDKHTYEWILTCLGKEIAKLGRYERVEVRDIPGRDHLIIINDAGNVSKSSIRNDF